jgi:hypothetical protein
MPACLGIFDHLAARRLPQASVGQVIGGWPQATGGDDEVSPGDGLFEGGGNTLFVVPHGGVAVDGDAQSREPAADPGGVGVQQVPEEDLGPDG